MPREVSRHFFLGNNWRAKTVIDLACFHSGLANNIRREDLRNVLSTMRLKPERRSEIL